MSKSLNVFNKMSDGLKVNFDSRPTDQYINYLNNYDTTNADNVYANLGNWASRASNNLKNMGDYTFRVDGSEAAKKRMEDATFQNYLGKIMPSYEAERDALQTRLLNQGIGVDSKAYRSAMENLFANQNEALNDGAYQAISAGQNAFNNDLNNNLSVANFANTAQQNYINQLISALTGSLSKYDIENEKYNVGNALAENRAEAQNNSLTQKLKALKIAVDGGESAATAMLTQK
ncbi:MAG: hypothetical protein IJ870_03030 [Alphaproteobacteria bacterium]|nr:hypothetical protein [Alphaproteobacteria bacterium]